MLRVTVLGCGGSSGVPQVGGADGRGDWGVCDPGEPRNRRSRTSIAVVGDAGTLLVDTTPDLRSQLLDCAVARVDAILFTHGHADHVTGLDDVRGLNRILGRPLSAIGTKRTLDDVSQRFPYAFQPWRPPGFFRPVLTRREIEPGQAVRAAGLDVETFIQDHHFMPTLGLRIGRFGYSTDVVALDDAAFTALKGIDTWLVGCFQRRPHRTHAHVDLVASWVERLRPRRTILTHMGTDLDWSWMQSNLPDGIEPAHDGMILDVDAKIDANTGTTTDARA